MKQWFLDVQPLAQRAKTAVKNGEIKFYPANKAKEIAKYFDELRDWNLSRQIPWGIPIPAFQNVDDPDDWIFDPRVENETLEINGVTYKRDEDTFDTWFSSGQWPFITTDYLSSGELSRFYPNSVMETGQDLLRQWVARMIMLGLYATDQVPFRDVFMHGLILDEHGVKMSKSKGNVINPMDIIGEYGSDALRLGIVMNRAAGQNQAFSTASVVAGRNFCNKLWNMARLAQQIIDDPGEQPATDDIAFAWAAERLSEARDAITDNLDHYRFAEAVETLYHFVWDDLADWFMEAEKYYRNPTALREILNSTLRLAHPFAPFVTEAIWTTLHDGDDLLISAPWPEAPQFDAKLAKDFTSVQNLVNEIRLVTTQLPSAKYPLIYTDDPLVAQFADLIQQLANLKAVEPVDAPRGLRLANTETTAWLDISDELLYEHQTRLEERLADERTQAEKLAARLSNQGYIAKAPANLVQETRDELATKQDLIAKLVAELKILKS
jgi:valyl-tRNA synthetase